MIVALVKGSEWGCCVSSVIGADPNRDFEAAAAIRRHLDPSESLIWAGRPPAGVAFVGSDLFLVPFSLVWTGAVVVISGTAFRSGFPIAIIVPAFFLVIGLYLSFGRFAYEAHRRGRTRYGLTSKRIVIVSRHLGTRVKSIPLGSLPPVQLNERANGVGSITFGSPHPFLGPFANTGWCIGGGMPAMFFRVPHAKRVFDSIIAAQGG